MRLADALLTHRPRETSGSSSANRFNFQRTWALCHLLQLHESDQSYVLILEYHDDVLVLDDDVDPQAADFFQVKTRRDGHLSKRDLLAVPTDNQRSTGHQGRKQQACEAPRSILGKLLEHCRHFLPQIRTLNIVSNVTFKIKLTNAPASIDRERFCLSDLTTETLDEIKAEIKKELKLEGELPWDKIYLLASGISFTEHEKYGAGELSAFLNRRRPDGLFAVQPLFRTLCGELSRRATNEWHPQSFDELCQKKGIRRADLERFLRFAERQPDPEEQLHAVIAQLRHENATYREVREIEASWRRYSIDRIDQADMTTQLFKDQVVAVVSEVAPSTDWQTLCELLLQAQETFIHLYGSPIAPFDLSYLRGALLYEFKSYEARQLSSVDSQLTPEKA